MYLCIYTMGFLYIYLNNVWFKYNVTVAFKYIRKYICWCRLKEITNGLKFRSVSKMLIVLHSLRVFSIPEENKE